MLDIKCVVERVDADKVVLIMNASSKHTHNANFPRDKFPEDIKKGDSVNLRIEVRDEEVKN